MPTVFTHAVVGLGFAATGPGTGRRPLFWALSAGLSMLPDLDVVAMAAGIPYHSVWSHRGFGHSLTAAVLVGALTAAVTARRLEMRAPRLAVYFALVMASHGVLDAFTDGGLGVAFWAPFDAGRSFFPWRPITVSPLGLAFFSERGGRVLVGELAWIWLPVAAVVGVVWGARAALASRFAGPARETGRRGRRPVDRQPRESEPRRP